MTKKKVSKKDLELNPELEGIVKEGDEIGIPSEEEVLVEESSKKKNSKKSKFIQGDEIISETEKELSGRILTEIKTAGGLSFLLTEEEYNSLVS